ncbi:MAG: BON domain-containing protein [Limisphaerales bacterium]
MKKTLVVLAAVGLVAVGCERRDTVREGAGAQQQQIDRQEEAQVQQLEAQQDAVQQEADAQQRAIEAQADARQAELDAQAEQVRAQAEAERAQLEAQQAQQQAQQEAQQAQAEAQQDAQQVQQEAAGAGNEDRQLETRVRQTLLGDQQQPQPTAAGRNVTIQVREGTVTLSGTVQSQEESQQLEQKARQIEGVRNVENNLRVQQQ